ncbi:MAG: iron ABC transporter permease [Burkholderiales bacterium]|nr:iron ABC transporter permease [Burkholderiales bacterium]
MVRTGFRWTSLLLPLCALVLVLPVLALALTSLQWDAQAADVLRQMAQTVLPEYAATSLWLSVAVAIGVAVVGMGTACVVTQFEFPGRRVAEWALLLPLAMPAYVVAYAYTDFLQFSGPLQTLLRETFGLRGRMFPEVRNLGGAVWVFTFTLYPYVYLLARTALTEHASQLMEAARLLGAPLSRRLREVALPLARPAVAAGVALALMETLADFGVASYFGIQTFTAGIYKAWLVMDNRLAAAQLATLLLASVGVLLWLERHSQRRLRFASGRGQRSGGFEARPVHLQGAARWVAWGACSVPVLTGFVLPVLFMLRPLMEGWETLPIGAYGQWALNSLLLALVSAMLATALAFWLAFAQRRQPGMVTRGVAQLVGLGYAVPGAVVVVGLLLPVGGIQRVAPQASVGYWVTATVLGVLWAYMVRFTAVALQSVQSGYARISPALDDSARMLGSSGVGLLRQVHWPLLRGSTAAAILLVFVDVMKELPATLVLRPFNWDTLAVVTYQLARDERLGEAALPALTLVAVGLIPVIMLSRTLQRRR